MRNRKREANNLSVYPIILSQKQFAHKDELTYPFEERGLQFGDGVYEVIRIYEGRTHLLEEHVERLFRSAEAIHLSLDYTVDELVKTLEKLITENKMTSDGKIYLQVTRGSARRDHVFPDESVEPNVYAYIEDLPRNLASLQSGVSTITHEDIRWDLCHIKSLNLLPNVLAKQAAKEQGSFEAILHENGTVTEASSANVFLIKDGKIYTHPATEKILRGCVRMKVFELAENLDLPLIEESFTIEDIQQADEMFLTSTTAEVMPIVKVDDIQIANGTPGEITRKLQAAYEEDAQITRSTIIETA